jgi:hypothetical protein
MTVTRFARERQLRRFCTVVSIATLGLAAPAVIQSVRAGAEPTPPGAGQFVPMTPSRVVKTTANIGWSGQI